MNTRIVKNLSRVLFGVAIVLFFLSLILPRFGFLLDSKLTHSWIYVCIVSMWISVASDIRLKKQRG